MLNINELIIYFQLIKNIHLYTHSFLLKMTHKHASHVSGGAKKRRSRKSKTVGGAKRRSKSRSRSRSRSKARK